MGDELKEGKAPIPPAENAAETKATGNLVPGQSAPLTKPDEMPAKKKYSLTSISMYLRCPYQYYRRYILGERRPPSASLTLGRSFSEALDENYKNKMQTGRDMKRALVKEYFDHIWARERHKTAFWKDENPEEIKDRGVKTLDLFHKEVCVKVKPTSVQKEFDVELKNVDYLITGKMDIETKAEIIDNKIASRSWPKGKELIDLQPVIYSLGHPQEKDTPFRFDIGVATKDPKIQQIPRLVELKEKIAFLNMLGHLVFEIEERVKLYREMMAAEGQGDGKVFIGRRDHYLCSWRYCGYAAECASEWGWHIPGKDDVEGI